MAGDNTDKDVDEEYELLSHDEVERLRDAAHQGQGDLTEAVHEIRHVRRSIDDFTELLESVKDNILKDYADSPNPEEILHDIEDKNEKIAEAIINVTEKVDAIAENQQKILDELATTKEKIDDLNTTTTNDYDATSMQGEQAGSNAGGDEDDLFQDMDEDTGDIPTTDEDDGFFSNLLGS